jgi:hypothetical protein
MSNAANNTNSTDAQIDAELDRLMGQYCTLKRELRGAPVGFHVSDEIELDRVRAAYNAICDEHGLGWLRL